MPESQPILDALRDHAPRELLPVAIREARRMRAARHRRNLTFVALVLLAAFAFFQFRPAPDSTPREAVAAPTLRIFSTAEAGTPLSAFSTPASHSSLASFSSTDVPFLIRRIDDRALFELLQPYGPVIVYSGDRPTLLLINRHP